MLSDVRPIFFSKSARLAMDSFRTFNFLVSLSWAGVSFFWLYLFLSSGLSKSAIKKRKCSTMKINKCISQLDFCIKDLLYLLWIKFRGRVNFYSFRVDLISRFSRTFIHAKFYPRKVSFISVNTKEN